MAKVDSGRIVAVTGASGYIGSHVCQNLLENGYTVRACVRDKSKRDRTEHLSAMSLRGGGTLEIHEADMMFEGSYDNIFQGCQAVFHVAGNFGTDPRWTERTELVGRPPPADVALGTSRASDRSKSYDHGVYDSYVVSMKFVLASIKRSKTVKRLIYTSSASAGSCIARISEDCGATVEGCAYGKGKYDCERQAYDFGEETGVLCCSCLPYQVLGPILSPFHDIEYQHRLGEMFCGKYCLSQDWQICDVRDVAETQRRMLESQQVKNGSRYYNYPGGQTFNEELSALGLMDLLKKLFPDQANKIASPAKNDSISESDSVAGGSAVGSESDGSESDSSSGSEWDEPVDWSFRHTSKYMNPENTLGVCRHSVEETVRDTILSLKKFGVLDRQDVVVAELKNFYNVAEMDGCEEEMQYIEEEFRKLCAKSK